MRSDDAVASEELNTELDDGASDEELGVMEEVEATELAVLVEVPESIVVALDAINGVDEDEGDKNIELVGERGGLEVSIVDVSGVATAGYENGELEVSNDELEVDSLDVRVIEV